MSTNKRFKHEATKYTKQNIALEIGWGLLLHTADFVYSVSILQRVVPQTIGYVDQSTEDGMLENL